MWRDIQPHILAMSTLQSPPSTSQIEHVCDIDRHSSMATSCYNRSLPLPNIPLLIHSACSPMHNPRQCDMHYSFDTCRSPNWIHKPRSSLRAPVLYTCMHLFSCRAYPQSQHCVLLNVIKKRKTRHMHQNHDDEHMLITHKLSVSRSWHNMIRPCDLVGARLVGLELPNIFLLYI